MLRRIRRAAAFVVGGWVLVADAERIDAGEKSEQGTVVLDFSSSSGSAEDAAAGSAAQHSDVGSAEEWRSLSRRRSERDSYFHPRGSRYSHQDGGMPFDRHYDHTPMETRGEVEGGFSGLRDHYYDAPELRAGGSRHFRGLRLRENASGPASWLEQDARGASNERMRDSIRERGGRQEGARAAYDDFHRGGSYSHNSALKGPDDGDDPKIEMKYEMPGNDYGDAVPKAKEQAYFAGPETSYTHFDEKNIAPTREFGSEFAFDANHDASVGWREGPDNNMPTHSHGRGLNADMSPRGDARLSRADDVRGGVHFASLTSSEGHSEPGPVDSGSHCSTTVPHGRCSHEGLRCEYVDDECGKNDNLGVAKAIATCILGRWGVVEVALACPPQPDAAGRVATGESASSLVDTKHGHGGSGPIGLLETDADVKSQHRIREQRRNASFRGGWGPLEEKAWRDLRSQHGKGRPIASRNIDLDGIVAAELSSGVDVD